jgi:hypothetical protein
MKVIFLYSLLIVCALNCANIEKGKKEVYSEEDDNRQTTKLESGKYGDVSIAVSGDTVTGVYEYYDKWNESAKQFTDVNVFYFFGRLSNGKIAIKSGWPGEELISGLITYDGGIRLALKDQPNGYAAVDFEGEGYKFEKTANRKWQRIGIIRADKAYLHQAPSLEKTRIFVVANDVVKIIEKVQGWSRVEYSPLTNSSKIFTGWIQDSDLYSIDPDKW